MHKGESLTFLGCIKISPNHLSKPLELRIFSGNFFSKKSYFCTHVHIPFHIDPQIWPHAIARAGNHPIHLPVHAIEPGCKRGDCAHHEV